MRVCRVVLFWYLTGFNGLTQRIFPFDRSLESIQEQIFKSVADPSVEPIKLKPSKTRIGHTKEINCIAISPNDRLLASGLFLSPTHSGKPDRLTPQTRSLAGLDHQTLVSSGNESDRYADWPQVRFLCSLSLCFTMEEDRRGIWCVAFSPVDKVLASAGSDQLIRLWSLKDYTFVLRPFFRVFRSLTRSFLSSTPSFFFSPPSPSATRSILRSIQGHSSSILQVQFLTHGIQLASSSSDGVIRLWSLKTAECLCTLDLHSDKVWGLFVHENGQVFVLSAFFLMDQNQYVYYIYIYHFFNEYRYMSNF